MRLFRHHIALLQARFSHWQHKTKFARTQIRTLISSLQPSDPPYILYSAHLVLISLFTSPVPPASPNNHHSTQAPPPPPPPSPIPKAQDVNAALAAIQDLETLSKQQNHSKITLLAHVLRLRILTTSNQWSEIPQSLQIVETALGLSYDPTTTPKPPRPPVQEKSKKPEERLIFFENPFEASMAIHVIFIGVVYYTYVGDASRSSPRLSHLHGLLDGGALETFADGVVSVSSRVHIPC